MTSRLSKLALAAALAASVPALAAARDEDRGADRDHRPPVAAPAPWQPAPPAPPLAREERDERHHREASWRGRELASIRAQLAALDADRAEFHRLNAWRPGQLRRYDRRYFDRRATLERRERELERVAWR